MAYARYEQATGRFSIHEDGGGLISVHAGFAGNGAGHNNPALEAVRWVGPLPRGNYIVAEKRHARFAWPAFRLKPDVRNEMFDRSGFWIHGGSKSLGCILLPRVVRLRLIRYEVDRLEVVPGIPARPGT